MHRETTAGAKEGFAFRYVSRPAASVLLVAIRRTAITPNQVTMASLLVGVVGSVVVAATTCHLGLVLGGLAFVFAHVLDALDGQLARARRAGSEVGKHFDFLADELKAHFVLAAVALRLQAKATVPGERWLFSALESPPPTTILMMGMGGVASLAIGIACTHFVRLPSYKTTFPGLRLPGTVVAEGGLLRRSIAIVERVGKFVIDYPSYWILLCVLNVIEIYFVVYSAVLAVYALRATLEIGIRLCLLNPYRGRGDDAP